MALFHVCVVRLKKSKGINLIILISRAAQTKNQSVELVATKVEKIREKSIKE